MNSMPTSTLDMDYPVHLAEHDSTSSVDFDPNEWRTKRFSSKSPPRKATHDHSVHSDYDFEDIFKETISVWTDFWGDQIDLLSLLVAEFNERKSNAREARYEYWTRIESLISDAELDGFTLNRESERDFWSFVTESVPFATKGELTLVDNGNLRAVWEGEEGSHFGLQFLGGGMAQYVIFRRRKGSSHVSRVAGRDTFEGVRKQARNFALEALLGL